MSSEEIVIDAVNLSKRYEIYPAPRDRMKQLAVPPLIHMMNRGLGLVGARPIAEPQYFTEFWALHEASFQVRKGEAIGIVGRNGSGKSTLLQMICNTLTPTSGHVTVYGRISALLELGSGFNPDYTGRQNIYLNGQVLGLSIAEIDQRMSKIIEFAEIGDFIDRRVKTYSSGMAIRLAFSVAINTDPSILVVDEALSVGDMLFQLKCFNWLKRLRENGTSILLVSHDLATVRAFCDRAIYLKAGRLIANGPVAEIVKLYEFDSLREQASKPKTTPAEKSQSLSPSRSIEYIDRESYECEFKQVADVGSRQGAGALTIVGCFFVDQYGERVKTLNPEKEVGIVVVVESQIEFEGDLHISVQINQKNGAQVAVLRDSRFSDSHSIREGERFTATMRFVPALREGDYYATLGVLTFPKGRKYVHSGFNMEELQLEDFVETGIAFSVERLMHHPISVPVLLESRLTVDFLGVAGESVVLSDD